MANCNYYTPGNTARRMIDGDLLGKDAEEWYKFRAAISKYNALIANKVAPAITPVSRRLSEAQAVRFSLQEGLPTDENPRPALKTILDILADKTIKDIHSHTQLAANPLYSQTCSIVRREIRDDLRLLCTKVGSRIQRYRESYPDEVLIPFPETDIPCYALFTTRPQTVELSESKIPCYKIKIDSDFGRSIGANSLEERLTGLKAVINTTSRIWVLEEAAELRRSNPSVYKKIGDLAQLLLLHETQHPCPVERLLFNGFIAGIQWSLDTMYWLAVRTQDKLGGKTIPENTLKEILEEHDGFILQSTKINLPTFTTLFDGMTGPSTPKAREFIAKRWNGTMSLEDSEKIMSASPPHFSLKGKFFRVNTVGSSQKRRYLLDFNPEMLTKKFSSAEILGDIANGCPSTVFLPQFISWLREMFVQCVWKSN